MNRIFTVSLLLSAALMLEGCVTGERVLTSAGLGGRILDARIDQPIAGATVTVTYASDPFTVESRSRRVVTGNNGDFNLLPEYKRRWGSHKDAAPLQIEVPVAVTVECPGYESFAYFFRRSRQETGTSGHFVMAPVSEDSRSYRLMPVDVKQARQ